MTKIRPYIGRKDRDACEALEALPLTLTEEEARELTYADLPDLQTGLECWIAAGGAHHTTLTHDVSAEQLRDWARIMGIEFVHIGADTTVEALEHDLFLSDLAWKLRS